MKLFWLLALASAVLAQTNLDMETGEPGRPPTSWNFGSAQAGFFSAEWVAAGCQQGSGCATMSGAENTPAGSFGLLSQFFSAEPFLNKRIRYRAWVRVEGGATVQTWLRLDRANNSVVSNNLGPAVRSGQWASYDVIVDIPEGARISIGFLQFGTGRAWVDSASLTAMGELRRDSDAPAGPLADTGMRNLVAFAKLAGYLRFFHPSDQAAVTDWDNFVVEGVRRVEGAASIAELTQVLQALAAPVAPTVRVFETARPPEPHAALNPANRASLSTVYWDHFGAGLGGGSTAYRSARARTLAGATPPSGYAAPGDPLIAELAPGVSAMVPLALYVENGVTLPAGPSERSTDIWIRTARDRATRLASVIAAWNTMQHFFPYFDHAGVDWPAALETYLRRAATDAGPAEFGQTLRRMNALLRDGHGSVTDSPQVSYRFAPLSWEWVDDQLIVARVSAGVTGIRPGDRVLRIDGKPVEELAASHAEEISSATPQWIRYRLLGPLSYCTGDRMQLDIEPYAALGTTEAVTVTCGLALNQGRSESRPAPVAELEPGIMYVDIDRASDPMYQAAIPRLAAARGIVFDLRGYPVGSALFLNNLTRTPITSAQWLIPSPARPDQVGIEYRPGVRWDIRPIAPYFEAKRVFLTDGRAISYAESVMGIIEAYGLAEIVGATTAGTNGNVNPFALPTGHVFNWTGMKVLKHDDSPHHGVGIAATIPAARTRAGIAEGRDEVLARGLEVVKAAIASQ